MPPPPERKTMSSCKPDRTGHRVTADEVREILVADTGVAREALLGQDTKPLEDLGLDSLANLQLQSSIDRRYGVELPDDALSMSVAGLVAFIDQGTGRLGIEGGG
jgi:acyl carrier protein